MPEETSINARKLWVQGATDETGAALLELGQDNRTGEITSLTLKVPTEDGAAAIVTLDGQQVTGLLETVELVAPNVYAQLCPHANEHEPEDDEWCGHGHCLTEHGRNFCPDEEDDATELLGSYGTDRYPFEIDAEQEDPR